MPGIGVQGGPEFAMKCALVCGAGGLIGSHPIKRLKGEGFWVRGVDLKYPQFSETPANDFVVGDLRGPWVCRQVVDRRFDEVYRLAADMGGAGFVFIGDNEADIMHDSALINLNILEACHRRNVKRIFDSSSACIYPEYNPLDPDNPKTAEDSRTRRIRTASRAGRSFSANEYTSLPAWSWKSPDRNIRSITLAVPWACAGEIRITC